MNAAGRHSNAGRAVIASVAVWACWVTVSAVPRTAPEIQTLMTRVGGRVSDYYRRAQSVVCLEQSTVQPIQWNWSPEGLARTVESELRLEVEPADGMPSEAKAIRNIRRINGRAPRARDAKDRSGCTDPVTISPDPLVFLLPTRRDEYRFTSARAGRDQDRAALIIDFVSTNRTSRPELVEDERGHADCFDWSGPVATRGRLWVDANTFEVLRLDRHNAGPVDVRVSWGFQRRYRLPPWVIVERDDLTVRYKPVRFSDPDEVIVLPESLVALTVVRTGLQSIRRTETYRGYRRFLTTGRMVKDP